MKSLGDIAAESGLPPRAGETEDKLYREDRCSCRKAEGVFGHGAWHLRRNPNYPHHPPADLAVERCQEYARLSAERGEWKRAIQEFEAELQRLASDDELRVYERQEKERDALAQLHDAQDRLADCERRLRRLTYGDEEGHS